ncbi:hypothetical protein PUNSTDRAFT_99490 [Punctularia strigosozonata HHB-11173 SS5]|uniref:uncharacterized protein n=1 Tax=Punctularia strigosozonata (strain HHB-11173) TaxID=741275 RepID=UPI000441855A|nr:uncharacterized protein PUNSTDRAFT_99490 [Punctularia strigosozonata HHB-11173 SS5]EIN12084.1 hypothetical protein PUNSTDRAFT_99490 [Punctularia strigosozonata HHB-11173 SS5]
MNHPDEKLPLHYSSPIESSRPEDGPAVRDVSLACRCLAAGLVSYALYVAYASSRASQSELPTHFALPSGSQIPAVALGVWRAKPDEVISPVQTALAAAYRHIDDAWAYHNEAAVGRAVNASFVDRSQIWITTKLWNEFHHPDDVEAALDRSLSKLGTDYVDLYLMHWPVAFKKGETHDDGSPVIDEALTADPYPTWQKLEEMVEKGKARNIGVSNFNIRRMQNLTANPLKIRPAVNQVELNLFNPQPDLLAWARANHLLLEAYSPLGSQDRVRDSLSHPAVRDVAQGLGITPAQVVLSWHVQRGTVVLPKSVTPARVVENLQVTRLPPWAFEKIESAANAHQPERTNNPSKDWGLGYDLFDDDPYDD